MIDLAEASKVGLGPYPVTIIPNHRLRLSDGTHLALRVWFPADGLKNTGFEEGCLIYHGKMEERSQCFATILEYLPYRQADYTAPRDYARHSWFCSHGYVIVRADIRGSGDSEGLLHDECTLEEQEDACEIIRWIAEQSWSNGAVGMFGKSWGGFNGLQVAYLQPPALKTVISIYSSHNRFSTDMHYWGGCVIANGLLEWGSNMFSKMARPPTPAFVPNWKQIWKERLEKAGKPWAGTWLAHQFYDDYWKNGSISEDYSRVKIPVLAIGGWADGYTDTVFQLVENLPNCRGLIGPWSHDWPDSSHPGPRIDFLSECLRWWDSHLKGIDNEVKDLPKLRTYLQDPLPPLTYVNTWPGTWINSDLAEHHTVSMTPLANSDRLVTLDDKVTLTSGIKFCSWSPAVGLTAGRWLAGLSTGPELAADQGVSDGLSLLWQTTPFTDDLNLLGSPVLRCFVRFSGGKGGQIAVRLCDIEEGGRATLITQGFLAVRPGNADEEDFQDVEVPLKATGYMLTPGHRLRLVVSPGCWPSVWPSSTPGGLQVKLGPGLTCLTLLVVTSKPEEKGAAWRKFLDIQPRPLLEIPHRRLEDATLEKISTYDFGKDTYTVTVDETKGRIQLLPISEVEGGVDFSESSKDQFQLSGSGVLSAKASAYHTLVYRWPGVVARIITESRMWADADHYHLFNSLKTFLDDELFFKETWKESVARL